MLAGHSMESAVAPRAGCGRTQGFVREITSELASGSVSFPTSMDATLRIRRLTEDPACGMEDLAKAVSVEPLLAAKLVRLANSAALRVAGSPVADVRTAVLRVGFARTRTLSIAVAIDQLVQSRHMRPVLGLARALWMHSVDVASLACVLAKRFTRLNPDEALYAGVVHDIGQFYLLSRAVEHPELLEAGAELSALMFDWHRAVGHALLESLATPEPVLAAVDGLELYEDAFPPRTTGDVLWIADQLARAPNPFAAPGGSLPGGQAAAIEGALADAAGEVAELAGALQA
ncbi:MAG: HDOD domain-containing protein [Rhodocyclaceae bacterium]